MSYVLVKNNDWATVTCNNVQVSIPKVWQIAKLRDSVKSYIGGDYGDDTDGEDKSEVDVYTLHVFNTNYEKAIAKRYLRTSKLKGRALDVGDILLEKCGGSPKNPVGRMYQLTKASTRPRTAVNFITILKLVECVDAKYLYAHLRYLYKNGVTRLYEQKTTGIANLKTEDFLNHEIQKPSSLVEQTAIANILSDQEALIAQYDNLIALHEKRFAYLSDELLSGRVRVRNSQDDLTIERNNEKWPVLVVQDVVFIFNGYPCSRSQMGDDSTCGVPILKMSNIEEGRIIILKDTQQYFSDTLKMDSVPRQNDMLVGLSGSVGKSGVFTLGETCIVNQRIAILRVKDSVNQTFFNFVWAWSLVDALLKNIQSSTIANVSAMDIARLTFSCPPLEEQTLIANVLSDQEALITQYKKLRDAEKKRFDWLSDALLSGTYRVKVEA